MGLGDVLRYQFQQRKELSRGRNDRFRKRKLRLDRSSWLRKDFREARTTLLSTFITVLGLNVAGSYSLAFPNDSSGWVPQSLNGVSFLFAIVAIFSLFICIAKMEEFTRGLEHKFVLDSFDDVVELAKWPAIYLHALFWWGVIYGFLSLGLNVVALFPDEETSLPLIGNFNMNAVYLTGCVLFCIGVVLVLFILVLIALTPVCYRYRLSFQNVHDLNPSDFHSYGESLVRTVERIRTRNLNPADFSFLTYVESARGVYIDPLDFVDGNADVSFPFIFSRPFRRVIRTGSTICISIRVCARRSIDTYYELDIQPITSLNTTPSVNTLKVLSFHDLDEWDEEVWIWSNLSFSFQVPPPGPAPAIVVNFLQTPKKPALPTTVTSCTTWANRLCTRPLWSPDVQLSVTPTNFVLKACCPNNLGSIHYVKFASLRVTMSDVH
mmetsp:Transcript_214/g.433  ORF Transcript_214/g.433 Transcript_214/m.433 type:complete len:437 (-) Transcript_214:492-1802(-)